MTDASNGASELYYIKGQQPDAYRLMVNYFNAYEGNVVPFKVVVGHEKPSSKFEYPPRGHRRGGGVPYMINPNNVLLVADTTISKDLKQKTLGLVVTNKDECRFYLSEISMGSGITARFRDYQENARKAMIYSHASLIDLETVLKAANVEVVRERDVEDENQIDLSPTSLEKDTFIKILTGKL